MAGAAVGVSHLVQSTRAGAEYGLALVALVLIGCLLKFPFLEFGPRYAAATGESLIAGYRRMGRWALGLFALITVSTMFIVTAAVTLVTAGLTGLLLGLELSITTLSALVLAVCALLLALGHYRTLDRVMKLVMAGLALVTVLAVGLALAATLGEPAAIDRLGDSLLHERLWTGVTLGFVLALLGWMPIPLDAAAWHSLWTLERARQTGHRPSLHEAGFDFRLGYLGATLLAVAFLLLGALTMYGRGSEFAGGAVAFAAQFADLYGAALGDGWRPLIVTAALATMFSTTLTVLDAFPRVLRAILEDAGDAGDPEHGAADRPGHRARYLAGLVLIAFGALVIIDRFGGAFTQLIDFITTVSFLAAPVIAWLNLRLLTGRWTPEAARPGPALRALARAGLVFLVLLSVVWVGWQLVGAA
ncbi:Nramp family divalent metal transporter [Wenzhouxiangella sp. XN79A]|nr:Nramp family divalent metal transporter [Wenzhouxiangella sp. XN79A]